MSNTTNLTRNDSRLHQLLETTAQSPDGFAVSEFSGYAPEVVRRVAQAMVGEGRLHRARVGARRIRYFASAEMAERYTARPAPGTAPRQPVLGSRQRARWAPDEPGIITSRTRITKAPPLPRDVYRTNTYPQF